MGMLDLVTRRRFFGMIAAVFAWQKPKVDAVARRESNSFIVDSIRQVNRPDVKVISKRPSRIPFDVNQWSILGHEENKWIVCRRREVKKRVMDVQ